MSFVNFCGKIPKYKHHLILKLGQINSKFQNSMTETSSLLIQGHFLVLNL